MQFFNPNRLGALEAKTKTTNQQIILVVDDEAANRQAITSLLSGQYQLLEACDGQQALAVIEQIPDKDQLVCIISDQRMPNLTGVELFERLLPQLPRTIRIIVTGFIDVDAIVDAVNRAHIYQFFIKPFDPHDFILTIKRAVQAYELQMKLDTHHALLETRIAERTRDLELAYANLEKANFTDNLTGLNNRRFLLHHIESDANLNAVPPRELVFMLLDIDHFKAVNDQYGHAMGDQLLIQVAQRLRDILPETDYLIRWGGEEFLLVLRQTPHGNACLMAEQLRSAIAHLPFALSEQISLSRTCSIGFACLPFTRHQPDIINWEQIIDLADQGLYMAKNGGRNAWVGFIADTFIPADIKVRSLLHAPQDMADDGLIHIVSNLNGLGRGMS
ncbi:MAG: hypothetical protein RL748_4600 [Pseudomonadota bacterium]|jgi:diguanylate cyclase (GGDEF)-like protein